MQLILNNSTAQPFTKPDNLSIIQSDQTLIFKQMLLKTIDTSTPRPWRIALLLSASIMMASLFFDSLAQDIDFWRDWILQFQAGGYKDLDANYPPILLHWLRILAWLTEGLGIPRLSDWLIKGWVELPIFLTHLYVLDLIGHELERRNINPLSSWIFWLTAVNPAFLINGPIWGQADLLPLIPLIFALRFSLDENKAHLSWPFFVVALLCKFQAIVFAPLLFGLSLRFPRKHVVGALDAIIPLLIAFLPFIVAGVAIKAFNQAYINNLNIYPYSSLHAANLWHLVTGTTNFESDSTLLLSGDWRELAIAAWLTPKKVGLCLFALLSLFVAYLASRKKQLSEVYGLAVLSMAGFFALSSGMHERYMFLALPFAALWACHSSQYRYWYPILTALVYINMNFVLQLNGQAAWLLVSICVLASFSILLLQLGFDVKFNTPRLMAATINRWPSTPYFFILFLWTLFIGNAIRLDINFLKPVEFLSPAQNVLYLSAIEPNISRQDYGELKKDSNLSGGPLCMHEKCYAHGLATHANAYISYTIPDGAKRFSTIVGIDDDSKYGQLEFIVELDDEEVWRSSSTSYDDGALPVSIPLDSARKISLIVDSLGEIHSDHADWAEARFER